MNNLDPEIVNSYCRRLRLSAIAENWQTLDCDNKEEYLGELLKLELKAKNARRTNRLLNQAKFPYLKTLEDFLWNDVELPDDLSIDQLISLDFIDQKDNLLLYGKVGTGNYRKFLLMERNAVRSV